MKTKQILFAAISAVLSLGLFTSTASAVVLNGNATAIILAPAGVAQTSGVDFGNIGGIGTVVLSSNGSNTIAPVAGTVTSGAPAEGVYTTSGNAGATLTIGVAPGTLTHADASTITFTPTASVATVTVGTGFTVGGSITLAGTETAGGAGYSGTYAITVNYQ